MTATDWVKTATGGPSARSAAAVADGAAQPQRPHRPTAGAAYVAESVELGYATTVHTAQGVTADTMHGLVTGEESRQQLYTMLTRGRIDQPRLPAGHRSGDPHSLIRPETVHPSTATELLDKSWLATIQPGPPAPCNATRRTRPAGSATPLHGMSTPSMWPPRTWPGAKLVEALEVDRADCSVSPASRPGPAPRPPAATRRTRHQPGRPGQPHSQRTRAGLR